VRFIDEAVPGVRPILHTRLFHPANDHYGMSPIALLDNSARSFDLRLATPVPGAGRKAG
jgi:hypothetical protein